MNALILENDGGEQRTPRVSACEPLCAILPMSTGQIHREYFAPKYGGLRRTKEKQDKGQTPQAAPGQMTSARSAGS